MMAERDSARRAWAVSRSVANRSEYRRPHCITLADLILTVSRLSVSRAVGQSMEWIELKRSSPVQIHEPLILIQSIPPDEPESESSPAQSGHNGVGIYQMPCEIDM